MARISDDLITSIKQDVSLLELVQAKGFGLKSHGKDFALRCPFHADDTASLVITPAKNLYHCFGCGAAGSVIDWVMKTEGVSFRHAVELLKNEFLPLAAKIADDCEPPQVVKHSTTPKLEAPLSADADRQTALRQVIGYYHDTLKQSPEALEYLASRGLNHPELIERFKLGFANRTLAYRLPQKNRKEGAELRGLLQEVGILRESGHEHFNGSIVVPVFDEHGLITEIYGRKLLGLRLRKGTAIHTYLPGPHRGVWNSEALQANKEIILCESLIDAMTFWVHGFRNVTASYGVSGFTDDHLAAFKTHGIEKVLIAYDRDDAGNSAAEKLAEKLTAEGIDCYRILFPKGMDANEYALKMQPAQKALELVIRKAEWMGNGKRPESNNEPEQEILAAKIIEEPVPENAAESTDQIENPEPFTPLAAGVVSAAVPESTLEAQHSAHEITLNLGPRRYRIRGLSKNLSYEQLKLNVLVSRGEVFHVDTFDFYSARHRAAFIKQAAFELRESEDVLKQDLGRVLLKLEELQDQQIQNTLEKKPAGPTMTDEEIQQALELLKSPDLLHRILDDFARCGVVGEETNKLVGYLAACSRKLDRPLAVMVQSSSAAGKSSLMEAVLAFIPPEERIQYSAMTGQSLFYMGETDLKHKILAIAEEEGAHNTSYALKLLQSEGEVTIASTGKNAVTGNLETQEYRVEGPVMLFSTTTAIDIDEELLNRCLVLSVDESREQTQAIHAAQRQKRTLAGLKAKHDKTRLLSLHQNAQRLLRPLAVLNPYADQLTFLDDKTRTRRDHEKYLSLIDTVTLLHQYQRDIKRESCHGETLDYIEVTLEDIAIANRLAHDVLGRSLDELPPQTRKLLHCITDQITQECQHQAIQQSDYRFSRKDVRQWSGWTDFQVKKHMHRLEEMEYVLIHRGKRGQSFDYELLYQGEGESGELFLMGLIDAENLQCDAKKEPPAQNKEPSSSPQRAAKLPPGSAEKIAENTIKTGPKQTNAENLPKNATGPQKINGASYRNDSFPPFTPGFLPSALTGQPTAVPDGSRPSGAASAALAKNAEVQA